ncbi:MAG: YtxH domain-containing protein [Chloroflexi bacterium]|nr:YtxH domain-containing protein [Chloroflexota bacterium]
MANDRELTSAGLGVGFLIGAIIGVAVGLLYAPRAGSETRARVKEMAETAIDKGRETASELKERLPFRLGAREQESQPAEQR